MTNYKPPAPISAFDALDEDDLNAISTFALANVPAEVILDPYHPVNQPYFKQLDRLQSQISAQRTRMRMRELNIADAYFSGRSVNQIAGDAEVTPTTVRKTLKKPQVEAYLSLRHLHTITLSGPSEAIKNDMLWRIAVDNEDNQPNTAISALAELNKGKHQEKVLNKDNGTTTINIQINNEILKRGALDG